MPNFIVPVVGNPNGGFQNGDQVTAENLNSHVTNAVPTGEFISGREESLAVSGLDYFLKLGEDGNLYKAASNLIGGSAELLRPNFIRSGIGDGVNSSFGSLVIEDYNNLLIRLGAYSDPLNPNGGSFDSDANSYIFKFRNSYVFQTNNNIFQIGTSDYRGWIRNYASVWSVDSTNVPEFAGNHGVKLPVGSTAQRPGTGTNPPASVGTIRYNSDISDVEFLSGNGWASVKPKVLSIAHKSGSVMAATAAGLLWRSTAEFDIPEDETWVLYFSGNWQTPGSSNTNPDHYFKVKVWASKPQYTNVLLKEYQRVYAAKAGENDIALSIPITKASLANVSKKIEIFAYATNSDTAVATIFNPSTTSTYNVFLYRYKTADYTELNAIL
jgi:hypothetical protein